MSRLKELYHTEMVPRLMKDLSYKSVMQVPRLEKIVINMGLGEAIQNVKILDSAVVELAAIAGQKAVIVTSGHAYRLYGYVAPGTHVRIS